MKRLIILRGLPGSGKSTRAQQLKSEVEALLKQCVICSADSYFVKDGRYQFDASKLGQAHGWCRSQAEICMRGDSPCVIIDNTNTQRWEYQPYLDLAKKYDYEVEVVVVGNLNDLDLYHTRGIHGVPKTALEKMAKRWEP